MATTSSANQSQAAISVGQSSSRQWPGEWEPTGLEVYEANQSPEAAFRERFKAALLQSEDGQENLHRESPYSSVEPHREGSTLLESPMTLNQAYTYPMSMLSDIPVIPDTDEVARLQAAFFTSFKHHVFLPAVAIPDSTLSTPAPYLQLALACIAAEISPYMDPMTYGLAFGPSTKTEASSALFHAGTHLWAVILEVDNRETRRLEAVIAAYLFATYGILSARQEDWRIAGSLVHNTATMARRIRLTNTLPQTLVADESPDRNLGMKSSLLAYMFLTDTIHSICCDAAPTYSTNELHIKMPSAEHAFREVYIALVHGNSRLPDDVNSREDSLLLLTGLLNDIIYLHNCYQAPPAIAGLTSTPDERDSSAYQETALRNPYAPLSARTEYERISFRIHGALDHWKKRFGQSAARDILALYYFCHLCLVCPDLPELSTLASYGPGAGSRSPQPSRTKQPKMSDKALDLAWLVLDSCDIQSEPFSNKLSIWLPVVLFYSALVIWQRLRYRSSNDFKYGTLKVLGMFKNEIIQLPWPCCSEMAATLDRLMRE